jgi:hypothetical protein
MPKHAPLFQAAVERLGVTLVPDVSLPWLTRHGHLASAVRSRLSPSTSESLDAILDALGGDAEALATKTRGGMRADFLVAGTPLAVEYDEIQHFTTARMTTLGMYPADAVLAFSPVAYLEVVERWRARGDRAFAHKLAVEFPGAAGRQRQRAYFDAFRDLAAPHFGNGPVLRVPAPDNNYVRAAEELKRCWTRAGRLTELD